MRYMATKELGRVSRESTEIHNSVDGRAFALNPPIDGPWSRVAARELLWRPEARDAKGQVRSKDRQPSMLLVHLRHTNLRFEPILGPASTGPRFGLVVSVVRHGPDLL